MDNPDNYLAQHAETLYFLFFCRDLAVFIFPTLLAAFRDPIHNRVPALRGKLQIAHALSILLLKWSVGNAMRANFRRSNEIHL